MITVVNVFWFQVYGHAVVVHLYSPGTQAEAGESEIKASLGCTGRPLNPLHPPKKVSKCINTLIFHGILETLGKCFSLVKVLVHISLSLSPPPLSGSRL